MKISNLQNLQKYKNTKYELRNLYIIHNKSRVFELFEFSNIFKTIQKKSNTSKVFWHCWPIL